jgi:hypothetical protein
VDLDLAAQVHQERAVGDVGDPHPRGALDAVDDLVGVAAVAGLDRDVAQHTLAAHLDQVHRPDVAAGSADGRGDPTQHARLVPDLEPDRETVRSAGGDGHQSLIMAGI